VQFQLIAHLSDGSKRDVTNEARWLSSPAAARVFLTSDVGLVVGLEPGEGEVEAWFDGRLALKSVMVLRAGTYRLSGNVMEAGVPSESVMGARVEITKGVGTGMTDETDQHGGFLLYGVSGEIGLRVTKDGYEPAVRTITVVDHQPVHKIELTPLGRRVRELWRLTTTIVSLEGSACFWTQPIGRKIDDWTLSVERSGAQVRLLYDVHNPHDNSLFVGTLNGQSFSAVSDTSRSSWRCAPNVTISSSVVGSFSSDGRTLSGRERLVYRVDGGSDFGGTDLIITFEWNATRI
jgi:hypothetical protein